MKKRKRKKGAVSLSAQGPAGALAFFDRLAREWFAKHPHPQMDQPLWGGVQLDGMARAGERRWRFERPDRESNLEGLLVRARSGQLTEEDRRFMSSRVRSRVQTMQSHQTIASFDADNDSKVALNGPFPQLSFDHPSPAVRHVLGALYGPMSTVRHQLERGRHYRLETDLTSATATASATACRCEALQCGCAGRGSTDRHCARCRLTSLTDSQHRGAIDLALELNPDLTTGQFLQSMYGAGAAASIQSEIDRHRHYVYPYANAASFRQIFNHACSATVPNTPCNGDRDCLCVRCRPPATAASAEHVAAPTTWPGSISIGGFQTVPGSFGMCGGCSLFGGGSGCSDLADTTPGHVTIRDTSVDDTVTFGPFEFCAECRSEERAVDICERLETLVEMLRMAVFFADTARALEMLRSSAVATRFYHVAFRKKVPTPEPQQPQEPPGGWGFDLDDDILPIAVRCVSLPEPTDKGARYGRYAPWIEIRLRCEQPVTVPLVQEWLLSRVGMVVNREAALSDFAAVLDLDLDLTYTPADTEFYHLLFVNQLLYTINSRCPIPKSYVRAHDFTEGGDGYMERHGDVARLLDSLIEHGLISGVRQNAVLAAYPHTYSPERFASQLHRRTCRQDLIRSTLHVDAALPKVIVAIVTWYSPAAFRP